MIPLKLISSRDEAGNVRTFLFESGGATWIAGQSQGWVLSQAGTTEAENERWFTIASAPSEGTMNISTRVSNSAFKQALIRLSPGDIVETHDIGGDFTWEEDSSEPVVLVAGGIGITPYRSILLDRETRGKKLNAVLLYFNRTNEIPFREELAELASKHSEFTFVPLVGELVTADAILEHAPQANNRIVYLSGPEPMVESVGAALTARGVSIKQDWFPGYDEQSY